MVFFYCGDNILYTPTINLHFWSYYLDCNIGILLREIGQRSDAEQEEEVQSAQNTTQNLPQY